MLACMDTHHLPPNSDPAARPDLPPGAPLLIPNMEDRTMPPWESKPRRWAGWPVVGIGLIALGAEAALNFAVKHEGEAPHAVVAAAQSPAAAASAPAPTSTDETQVNP